MVRRPHQQLLRPLPLPEVPYPAAGLSDSSRLPAPRLLASPCRTDLCRSSSSLVGGCPGPPRSPMCLPGGPHPFRAGSSGRRVLAPGWLSARRGPRGLFCPASLPPLASGSAGRSAERTAGPGLGSPRPGFPRAPARGGTGGGGQPTGWEGLGGPGEGRFGGPRLHARRTSLAVRAWGPAHHTPSRRPQPRREGFPPFLGKQMVPSRRVAMLL